MINLQLLFVLVFGLLLFPGINYAGAHENLNSGDETIGNYEVQMATDPEIPSGNQPFKLIIRVLNHQSASNLLNSLNTQISEVEHFRMGIRIYYNDQLVGTIPVQRVNGGEWSSSYVFHESGNHIVNMDLYDVGPNGKTLTYTFNVSVLNVFGPMFQYIISAGGIGCFVILGWILITRKKVRPKH